MERIANIWAKVRELYGRRYDPEYARGFADVYWRGLLALAFIVLAIMMFYGERELYAILNDIGDAPGTQLSPPPIDRNVLQATVSSIESRQNAFNTMQSHLPSVPSDPSR